MTDTTDLDSELAKAPVWTSLAAAQQAVMSEVSYVKKQYAQMLRYDVATESDVIKALRKSMLRHGLSVAPVEVKPLGSDRWDGAKQGQVVNLIRLVITYRFMHADSGEHLDVQVVGEAQSYSDKCCAAAMTMAQKYALLEFFLLERGTDPELVHEHGDEVNAEEWKKAVSAIDRSATEEKLDAVLENIRTKAVQHFSGDNLDELVMYGERRRREIRKNDRL